MEESLGSPLDSPFDSPQQQTEGSEAIVTLHEKASSISLPPPESITTNDQSELKSPKKDGRGRRNSEGKRRKSNKIAASSSTASIDDRGLISSGDVSTRCSVNRNRRHSNASITSLGGESEANLILKP